MNSGIPCMIMRGGSSKGAYFRGDDLPSDPPERDALLRRIMGSPDPRQIDGMGGAHPLTSKVAVVTPSTDVGADVDYLFLQVSVDDDLVTGRQNCGNLLAGVGPFAVERRMIEAPSDGDAVVRIRMLNTESVATARFEMLGGEPLYTGDTAISGVPGAAAAIALEFTDIAGSSTGAMLPTGKAVEEINGVACTLVDNGMPVVAMAATELGVTGYEDCADLEANDELRARLEAIRLKAGERMGLGDVSATTVPKLTMVAAPRSGGHLCTRTFIPHRCHDAIGVLGAVSVATAALLPESPAHALLGEVPAGAVRLEHPTGHFDALIEMEAHGSGTIEVLRAGIIRTARKLMDGTVFPRPEYPPT